MAGGAAMILGLGALGALYAFTRKGDSKAPPAPRGDTPWDPNKKQTNPASDPKDPLPILPYNTGQLPPVPYADALKDGSATIDQQNDFMLRYEVDPAALEEWVTFQLVQGDARIPGVQARIRQLLASPEAYAYAPNGYWPDNQFGLPMYLADSEDRLPRPDDSMTNAQLGEWNFILNTELDLGKLAAALVAYKTNYPRAADGVKRKIAAQVAVRQKYGAPVPPVQIDPTGRPDTVRDHSAPASGGDSGDYQGGASPGSRAIYDVPPTTSTLSRAAISRGLRLPGFSR